MNNEPVAWRNLCVGNIGEDSEWIYNEIGQGEPLYTHPADESFDRTASHMTGEYVSYPAKTLTDEEKAKENLRKLNLALEAQELTDEEIKEVWMNRPANTAEGVIEFARAILRKAQEK